MSPLGSMRPVSFRAGLLRPGLLRPRFGVPTILRVGATFSVESLEPEANPWSAVLVRPCDGHAFPLELDNESVESCEGMRIVKRRVRTGSTPAGGYDLVVTSGKAPFVAPRAVWLHEADPDAARPLQVAHI